ncbi:LytR/AlgR family response regulator transcription factor [Pedobacter flavus]|uniref:Response regulator transcription factor n=1 Tax=Pedobacter flavus TaxID=3113906 RepID=A0ABU7H0R8_9SPHI|nr:response regulator transcription factor [Pedobacter sp. VNH31]MEE1884929.1 response regulator transcription factor [Pedobacter sp. VNH31]
MESSYNVLEAKNAKEALEILNNENVDLAILDINLGENEQNGITLGQQIKDKYAIPFIYLTAFENAEIISQAISTAPYSYLTKPPKKSDLIASIEIAIRHSGKLETPKILVKDGTYNISLSVEDINYIESDGNYLLYHTDEKIYKTRSTIKKVAEELGENGFVQIHRAYIVNKNKIDKFSNKSVIIRNITIPVSYNYSENIYTNAIS